MNCLSCCVGKTGGGSGDKSLFHVKVLLLDKQELIQEVHDKTTGQDLLNEVFKQLNLAETAYFGLRFQDNSNQTHWLDPGKRVCRQLRGISPITLYLGVKFYAADPCRLAEEITRYQFFLQLKLDVLQGRLPVSQELAVELAAYALQSELGDYDPGRHSTGYVSEFRFAAAQTEEMEEEVEALHRRLKGLRPADAERTYLEKVKWLDLYGVDLHPVIGEDNIEYFLGLTPSGIIVLRNRGKVGNYFWPRIAKIYFKGRYFMLRVRDKNNDDKTYGFETPARQACKHLWKCCVEHHAFFRLVQVTPNFSGSGVFSLGSRFRYNGSAEKQMLHHHNQQQQQQQQQGVQNIRRPPPQFTRRPSSRFARRNPSISLVVPVASPGKSPAAAAVDSGENNNSSSVLPNNGSLNRSWVKSRQNGGGNRSTASLPRNVSLVAKEAVAANDVSLQSLQWLESRGLYGTNRHRRSSLSEHHNNNNNNNNSSHHHHHHNRRSTSSLGRNHNSNNNNSDGNESEASGVSWVGNGAEATGGGGGGGGGGHSRGRSRYESGSETESRSSHRRHRSRRKRQGSYKLVEAPDQKSQQQQQYQRSSRGRPSSVVEFGTRRSGYVNSGAETEAAEVNSILSAGAANRRQRRRQRSRSRSPAAEARHRLPAELLQHLEFGLVEPNQETMRGEIPYTNVETARPVRLKGRPDLTDSGSVQRDRHARRLHVSSAHSTALPMVNSQHSGPVSSPAAFNNSPNGRRGHLPPPPPQPATSFPQQQIRTASMYSPSMPPYPASHSTPSALPPRHRHQQQLQHQQHQQQQPSSFYPQQQLNHHSASVGLPVTVNGGNSNHVNGYFQQYSQQQLHHHHKQQQQQQQQPQPPFYPNHSGHNSHYGHAADSANNNNSPILQNGLHRAVPVQHPAGGSSPATIWAKPTRDEMSTEL